MPKPVPEEYFEITTRCPKDKLGELMVAINKLGLDDVKFDLVTAIPTFRNSGRSETTSVEWVTEWIKNNPTFKAKDAVRAAKEAGRSGSAIYPALATMVGNGVLKQLGEGQYARADVKALPAPKKANGKAKEKPVAAQHKYKVKNGDLILRLAKRRNGHFTQEHMKNLFEAEKRPYSSLTSTVASLVKAGKIKRVGDGQYELPKTNGAVEVTEVTNG